MDLRVSTSRLGDGAGFSRYGAGTILAHVHLSRKPTRPSDDNGIWGLIPPTGLEMVELWPADSHPKQRRLVGPVGFTVQAGYRLRSNFRLGDNPLETRQGYLVNLNA